MSAVKPGDARVGGRGDARGSLLLTRSSVLRGFGRVRRVRLAMRRPSAPNSTPRELSEVAEVWRKRTEQCSDPHGMFIADPQRRSISAELLLYRGPLYPRNPCSGLSQDANGFAWVSERPWTNPPEGSVHGPRRGRRRGRGHPLGFHQHTVRTDREFDKSRADFDFE